LRTATLLQPALAILFFILGLPGKGIVADFSITSTIGYEFVSQEFFLDSITGSTDALSVQTALKTTYLDDVKGGLDFRFRPLGDRRIELRSQVEQTPEFLRGKLFADFRPRWNSSRLELNYELDLRSRYNGLHEAGDNYVYGHYRGKWTETLDEQVSGWLDISGDFVNFDSTSDLSYDQYRFGGKTGLLFTFEDFSMLDLGVFYRLRRVPDSTGLDYESYGFESSLLGFLGRHELDLSTRLERRDYNQRRSEDDFWLWELDSRSKIRFARHLFLFPQGEFELNVYDSTDLVTYSYWQLRGQLPLGFQGSRLTVSLGPEVEWQTDLSSDSLQGDDYFEAGLAVQLDFLDISKLFLTAESILGHRFLKNQSAENLQTDFTYERLNIISDLKIMGGLSLNVLFSGEWEWHDLAEENNLILLLNTALSYKL